jgi:hypothetical protein
VADEDGVEVPPLQDLGNRGQPLLTTIHGLAHELTLGCQR